MELTDTIITTKETSKVVITLIEMPTHVIVLVDSLPLEVVGKDKKLIMDSISNVIDLSKLTITEELEKDKEKNDNRKE